MEAERRVEVEDALMLEWEWELARVAFRHCFEVVAERDFEIETANWIDLIL